MPIPLPWKGSMAFHRVVTIPEIPLLFVLFQDEMSDLWLVSGVGSKKSFPLLVAPLTGTRILLQRIFLDSS